MNRRHLLRSSALLPAAGLTLVGMAGCAPMARAPQPPQAGAASADLIAATGVCITRGETCLTHCVEMLGRGESAMAECAATVRQTLAACTALQKLAAQRSVHTARMAAVVARICDDCEQACRKHPDMPECVACADACADCAQACRKAAA